MGDTSMQQYEAGEPLRVKPRSTDISPTETPSEWIRRVMKDSRPPAKK